MNGTEQEFILKDIFIVTACVFGIFILLVVQLRNVNLRFFPIGRRQEDLEFLMAQKKQYKGLFHISWKYTKTPFCIHKKTDYPIWYVSPFQTTLLFPITSYLWKAHAHKKRIRHRRLNGTDFVNHSKGKTL